MKQYIKPIIKFDNLYLENTMDVIANSQGEGDFMNYKDLFE